MRASQVKAAGVSFKAKNENAAQCFKFPDPPLTPHGIKKYRRSMTEEPGKRIVHYGIIDDHMRDGAAKAELRFGTNTADSGDKVGDVFPHGPQTDMSRYLNDRKESIYKTRKMEVLGKTLDRGVKLPDKTSHKDFRFGSAPKKASAIGAKDLLYPVPEAETEEAKRLYQKSHGTFEPGVQRRRYEGENSDLGFDVQKKRFGMVGAMGDQNGVYKCLNNVEVAAANAGSVLHIVPKNVARFKESVEHKLGQCKNLGQAGSRPPNHKEHAYGVVDKSKTTWGAAECIQGSYTEEDQLPDLDLGRSVSKGWRNDTTTNRTFGCPTIRTDVKPPKKRSVGDGQNYGDDTNAFALLHPAQFAGMGVADEDFIELRERDEVRDIFKQAGIEVSDDAFSRICGRAEEAYKYKASKGSGTLTVESYRHAYNEYDNASVKGEVPAWWGSFSGKK
jgi:EF-hand domain-containing family member B